MIRLKTPITVTEQSLKLENLYDRESSNLLLFHGIGKLNLNSRKLLRYLQLKNKTNESKALSKTYMKSLEQIFWLRKIMQLHHHVD
mgnify:CR=1 FL=1